MNGILKDVKIGKILNIVEWKKGKWDEMGDGGDCNTQILILLLSSV